ncbi:hypothetical protein ACLVWQ_25615 [Streptomyces sp. CWNU-52B]|uniref:hypothetical protein n=1 Tax=unclassified Streptomyces TaxID=2593676 RepID=UPI0039C1F300
MLALRLARSARPAVQFRRLLVAAASAGTGFLLLCALGYALGHPGASTAAVLRLAWCLAPIAATVQFAVAVARTDPATRPRPGLSAIGLGPGRLMALAAVSTAASCTLGSLVALLVFLHLRGDLAGLPLDGAAAGLLAADRPLPLAAVLTLLALVPIVASAAGALVLRPRGLRSAGAAAGGRPRRLTGFGGYGRSTERVGFGAYGRFGTHPDERSGGPAEGRDEAGQSAPGPSGRRSDPQAPSGNGAPDGHAGHAAPGPQDAPGRVLSLDVPRRSGARGNARVGTDGDGTEGNAGLDGNAGSAGSAGSAEREEPGGRDGREMRDTSDLHSSRHPRDRRDARDARDADEHRGPRHSAGHPDDDAGPGGSTAPTLARLPGHPLDPHHPLPPLPAPGALPWGTAVLAAGLAVETYAGRRAPASGGPTLPGGFDGGSLGMLVGWALTAIGLALAGPALTHLCGRLLQTARPGALRLLAGRVLMEEATRIGRPLGVVCAVASGAYAMAVLYTDTRPDTGPLTTLGALLVAGCAVATLLTAAVEARNARADTTAALLRIGAPAVTLRAAAALRAGTLIAVLGPLTWLIAQLAALPLVR